jgi:polysaccharide biosynthesis protein PelE
MPMIDWIFDVNNIWLCWMVYCLLSLPLVYLMLRILPARFQNTCYYNMFFLYFICASIFIFGLVIAFVIVLTLYLLKPFEYVDDSIQTTDYPDYQRSPITKNITYGEGLGTKLIKRGSLSKPARQKMLIAINQFETPGVNKINSLVLCDDIDEIRLFAKSLIEKQEKAITDQLKNISSKINETSDINVVAYYKKINAQVLWEQIYRYLVHNENLISVIIKIKTLAVEAMQVLTNDTELPLLLAKVALRENDVDDARHWLQIAKNNHAPDYKTVTYFAEVDFLEKNYANIKNGFKNFNNYKLIGLQPIISFWMPHD